MQIRITQTFNDGQATWVQGTELDVPREVATRLVSAGVAVLDLETQAMSTPTSEETAALRQALSGSFTGVYASNPYSAGDLWLASFTRGGVAHTVSYTNATTAVVSNGATSRVVNFDAAGRVVAVV